MNIRRNSVVAVAVVLLLAIWAIIGMNPAPQAQSVQSQREFIAAPWIPMIATAPDNTVTTATLTEVYSGQPNAGGSVIVSGAYFPPEKYVFYADGGSYTTGQYEEGVDYGVEMDTTEDLTWAALATVISANSNFVNVGATAGTNTLVFTATGENFKGHNGNYITFTDAVTGIAIDAALTGGKSVRAGRAGSILYQDGSTTATRNIWIKTDDGRYTSGTWIRLNPQ